MTNVDPTSAELQSDEASSSNQQYKPTNTASGNTKDSGEVSRFSRSVSFLNDLKELFAIMVFFIGGAVWIYTAFATKQHVQTVRCLLETTIDRIDGEAQTRFIGAEISEIELQINELQNKEEARPEDISKAGVLRREIEILEVSRRKEHEKLHEARAASDKGECVQ